MYACGLVCMCMNTHPIDSHTCRHIYGQASRNRQPIATQTRTDTHRHACLPARMHAWAPPARPCAFTRTYSSAHARTHARTQARTRMHACMHAHTHAHAHAHTHLTETHDGVASKCHTRWPEHSLQPRNSRRVHTSPSHQMYAYNTYMQIDIGTCTHTCTHTSHTSTYTCTYMK